jgi:hypothetical protein
VVFAVGKSCSYRHCARASEVLGGPTAGRERSGIEEMATSVRRTFGDAVVSAEQVLLLPDVRRGRSQTETPTLFWGVEASVGRIHRRSHPGAALNGIRGRPERRRGGEEAAASDEQSCTAIR